MPETHPFLQPHEIPNSVRKTPESEAELNGNQVNQHKIFQPFDKRLRVNSFSNSRIVKYQELHENDRRKEILKKIERTSAKLNPYKRDFKNFAEETEKLHSDSERKAKDLENIKVFKSTEVEKIIDFLSNEELSDFEFEKEVEETKTKYANELAEASSFLLPIDWKILTAIRLFNKETFEHSVGTYLVAKDKIQRLDEIKNDILSEGVTLEQFYRSCLFHDIGKMAVPEFILNKRASDLNWITGFLTLDEDTQNEILADHMLPIPDSVRTDPDPQKIPQKFAEYIKQKRIRAVDFVPARLLFTDLELEILKDKFPEMKENDTLKDLIAIHEKKSEEMLEKLGFFIEAFLAGNHHNHKNKNKKLGEKSGSLTALNLSKRLSYTTLHLADMKHALESNRSYHSAHDLLRTLAFCVDAANNDEIDSKQTSIWIIDEISRISEEDREKIRRMENPDFDESELEKQKNDLEAIEAFLSKHL